MRIAASKSRALASRVSVRTRSRALLHGSRLPRAAVALGMSTLLWLYVGTMQETTPRNASANVYGGIPVELRARAANLVEVGTSPAVTVTVRNSAGSAVEPRQPVAYVDLSGVTTAGSMLLPVRLEGVSDSQVVAVRPPQVRVVLEEAESRTMSVRVRMLVAGGGEPEYRLLSAEPSQVTVAGARRAVDRVRSVTAVLDLPELRTGDTETVAVQAVDRSGRPVPEVALSPSEVLVTVPPVSTSTP